MREKIVQQLPLVPTSVDHIHAAELRAMSEVLDANPQIAEIVHADLVQTGVDPTIGREGMIAETVLRALLVKQMNGFSYEQLSFHLADSRSYRAFCRLRYEQKTSKSTLQRNIKKLRPETLIALNQVLILHAKEHGLEEGLRVRTDCTEVEANVRIPTDSSLLVDCVRVLVRLLRKTSKLVSIGYRDHSRVAKRRDVAINNAKSNVLRRPLYRDLLRFVQRTIAYCGTATTALKMPSAGGTPRRALADLLHDFAQTIEITKRVIDQTERRVFGEETVPASDKVVSIFETHTDIIRKGRRQTKYGHKLLLTTGKSGLVLDCKVSRGNPRDSELALAAIQRLVDLYGQPPTQACFDGGFSSKQNLRDIKNVGVVDVAFSKGPGLSVPEMVSSSWVYRCLKRFRAGIEGTISFLKRAFGLRRCTWRSFESFQAYVLSSVVAANVLILARATLA